MCQGTAHYWEGRACHYIITDFWVERELNDPIEFPYIEYWELKTQEVEETGSTLKT